MSGSHKEFPKKAVLLQLGLAALVGIGYLFADKPAVHAIADKVTKPIVAAAEKILAPIGKVEVKAESVASAARSGEEVYNTTCGTCHNTGIAGAPKLSDKASWETRLSDGFSALVLSSIKGKGGMPAKGGDPEITDSEMELAVGHIIKKAGIELVAKSASTQSEKKTEQKVESVKSEAPQVKEIAKEITPVAAAPIAVDHSKGESIYKSSCFACHQSGVAGSPKVGDAQAWASRIAAGNEAMYNAAIKGKGAMPAKGGNMSISDNDIKAAVDYMTANSQ